MACARWWSGSRRRRAPRRLRRVQACASKIAREPLDLPIAVTRRIETAAAAELLGRALTLGVLSARLGFGEGAPRSWRQIGHCPGRPGFKLLFLGHVPFP